MKHRTGLAAGALALAFTLAGTGSASAAAVMVYTYSGTVSSFQDPGDAKFGGTITPNVTSFTAVFTRDDNTPGAVQTPGATPFESSHLSGDGITSPVLARLEVGSLIFNFGSDPNFQNHYGHQLQRKFSDDGYEEFQLNSTEGSVRNEGDFRFTSNQSIFIGASGVGGNYLISSDYDSLDNLTPATTPLMTWRGYASFGEDVYDTRHEETTGSTASALYFTITSATVSDAVSAPAPEPGTWALMIGGFGLAGAALRRRRATVAA